MGPANTTSRLLFWLLAALLLATAAAAASAEEKEHASSAKGPPPDGPEARVELDDDEDFEAGEYDAPKTVLECMIVADWACVQVKTFRAIRLWLNIGTNVVQSKPQETPQEAVLDREAESKEGVQEAENHEDQEEPDTDEDEDLKEVTALFSGLGKMPEGDSSSWAGSLEMLAEMLYDGVSSFLSADSEDEQRAMLQKGVEKMEGAERQLEARKKILGGLGGGHGHHGVGPLLGLVTFMKTKAMVILSAFSSIIELKSLAFTVISVLIAAIQLYIQFKTTHNPIHPVIKVIHVHPRPHVTVHEEAEAHHAESPWDNYGHDEESYGYAGGYQGYSAHDRAYELQKPAAAAAVSAAASAAVLKSALLERYKNQLLSPAGRR